MSTPRGSINQGGVNQDLRVAEVSLLRLAAVPLRHIRLIFGVALSTLLLSVALYLIKPRSYVATSTFQPQTSADGNAPLAGLAAQFGVAVPIGGQESVAFYTELLKSRELLHEATKAVYEFRTEPDEPETLSGDLVALFESSGDTQLEREQEAMHTLSDNIRVEQDLEAGLITLEVNAPWPELAMQINRRMLDLLNRFNVEKRKSQAAQEREFAETRLRTAERELIAAEDSLEGFLERNRTYQSSPQLVFEAGRLQRRIDTRQQVFSSLAQAYEQARIEEVRNTPVITVLDTPEPFARIAGSGILGHLVIGLVMGGMVGFLIALAKDYFLRMRAEQPIEYQEFLAARNEARSMLPYDGYKGGAKQ